MRKRLERDAATLIQKAWRDKKLWIKVKAATFILPLLRRHLWYKRRQRLRSLRHDAAKAMQVGSCSYHNWLYNAFCQQLTHCPNSWGACCVVLPAALCPPCARANARHCQCGEGHQAQRHVLQAPHARSVQPSSGVAEGAHRCAPHRAQVVRRPGFPRPRHGECSHCNGIVPLYAARYDDDNRCASAIPCRNGAARCSRRCSCVLGNG